MRYFPVLLFILFSQYSIAYAQDSINEKNWVNHPAIKEVRTIVNGVHDAIQNGELKRHQKTYEYCSPNHDTLRMKYEDKEGKVMQYMFSGGTEDSAADFIHYYDGSGTVRFILKKAAAVNGTEIEVRIYFDERGKKIWTNIKTFKGAGWPGASELSDDVVVREPKKAFIADNSC